MEAWRQWLLGGRKLFSATNNKTHYEPRIPLTPTGLLMEGGYTSEPLPRGILSAIAISPFKSRHGPNTRSRDKEFDVDSDPTAQI
jgi:hypothetical protein